LIETNGQAREGRLKLRSDISGGIKDLRARRARMIAVLVLAACSPAQTAAPSTAVTTSASPSATTRSPTESPAPPEPSRLAVDVPRPGALVAGFGAVWVQSRKDGSVWRIDQHGNVVAMIRGVARTGSLGKLPLSLGVGFGSIWTLANDKVVRIDPKTNQPAASIEVPPNAYALAVSPEGVWVSCCAAYPAGAGGWPRLYSIDPSTNAVRLVTKEATSPSAFAVGEGSVWWGNFSEAASVSRFDLSTSKKTYIQTSVRTQFVVPTPNWVWLIDHGTVERLRPDGTGGASFGKAGKKAPQSLGVTYGRGTIWINAGNVVGFDADTGKVTARIQAAGPQDYWVNSGIALLGSHIWLVDAAKGQVLRVDL
jgi:hypothetical protein